MKNTKKILVALVFMLSLTVLIACGNDTDETNLGTDNEVTTEEIDAPETDHPEVEATDEADTGRSEVFEPNLEWAIGRVDFVYDQINEPTILADSFAMLISLLSTAQESIAESLPTPDAEINEPMRHLEMQIEHTLIPAIEDAQGLVDSGSNEAEDIMEMIAETFNPVLAEIREELEALK